MSLDRFAPAEAALKAGKFEEGAAIIERLLTEAPKAPAAVYRNYATMLVRRQIYDRTEAWAAKGLELYPRDVELMNLRGVALRRLDRRLEAIEMLARASKLDPKHRGVLSNLGNVYNDVKSAAAIDIFTKLARATPNDGELQRSLGRAYRNQHDLTKAETRFRLATKLKPDLVDAWLDLSSTVNELQGAQAAIAVLDQALENAGKADRLLEARIAMVRLTGQLRELDKMLTELVAEQPNAAWIHRQLAATIADYDRERANVHLDRALELSPDDPDIQIALAESLNRSRHGDEAAHIERAYQVLSRVPPKAFDTPRRRKIATEIFTRVCAFDEREALGDFSELGHDWAKAGIHSALLLQLARAGTTELARDLVDQHRAWGDLVQKTAARYPVKRSGPRPDNGKIRVGFMSSDLRRHPVAYFALPLLLDYDRSRFEVYCYSYYQGAEDVLQKRISDSVDAFRWRQDITDRDAAQMIADDQLDILIELGGSTHMNKLAVMALKPAALQASWLGYPHSAGPSHIDHIILDPHLAPTEAGLLIEKPLLMPKTWLTLAEQIFSDHHVVQDGLPEDRNGFITFGTANNPHKYTERLLRTWAKVVQAVPNSRFEFIRPEGNTPAFRRNVEAAFAKEGVSAERIVFRSVRGVHMQYYNEIDITLDPFPLTGGTSTCEALWMGVPVVNLRGPALFERLSGSILTNLGLTHHIAEDLDAYQDIAVKLAADRAQRLDLRANLRQRMKDSPLGQTKAFADDFYAMIAAAVTAGNTPSAASPEQAGN